MLRVRLGMRRLVRSSARAAALLAGLVSDGWGVWACEGDIWKICGGVFVGEGTALGVGDVRYCGI